MSAAQGWLDALRALREANLAEIHFDAPYATWWLLAGVLSLVGAFVRQPALPRLVFSRGEALAQLSSRSAAMWRWLARSAWGGAALLIGISALRPVAPGAPDPDRVEGIDIVVMLDVSGSMRAVDFKPRDRLHVAKKVIHDHLLTRHDDRIGLVVFAGEAFTQAPLTHDKRLLSTLLEGVRTGVITDGTAIGDALATGVNRLRDSRAKGRALILVTDGDNNAGNLSPEAAAQLAKEMGLPVFPILIGRGGRVSVPTGGVDLLGMPSYQQVVMPVNPSLLQEIASVTGGRFFSAQSPAELETSFQRILSDMEKTRLEAGPVVRRPIDLGPLLLLPAFALLFLSLCLFMTRASTVP
ncbi:MAG: VWA domain-containing protein [Myxococcota bacterium]